MESQTPQHNGWKFDKTVNLPVLITCLSFLVYFTLHLGRVDAKSEKAIEIASRVDTQQSAQAVATTNQIAAMRVELRSDVKDVTNKVDQLLMRFGDRPRNLDQWTK